MSPTPAQPVSASTAQLVTSLLGDGYDVRLRVSGWSMKPLIRSGAVIRFTPTKDPRRGDVVLTRHDNGALVAHRVVAMDERRIWTKGDACRTTDAPVSRDSIVARAVAWEGAVRLPLCGRPMRVAGLLLSRIYPLLVTAYRGIIPRKKRPC
jgi:Peptidase S24-like